ncbi:isoleucyl-tRNA synthetase family [Cyclospora cayetanensis]|uniref:isoleucine--tRNA ligase n=1 Tax=Cyclospora cayetanensis TaxID=88456 RepID=A0A1D3D3T6_9EIME|nr:isoleucyl-tRNA synthetase family [Cyclospora cayetanensis]
MTTPGGEVLQRKDKTAPLTFEPLPERPNFPAEEERTLSRWREEEAFKKSLELSKGRKPFSFYDGPPFATGLPHYGHILAGTIKDVVCRFAHQTGHFVERRFGWDCHGLPIEFEIDKLLKINTRQQVLQFGIPQYNEQCRSIVLRYSSQWKDIVASAPLRLLHASPVRAERTGRWIDFNNGYRTMDRDFMESVWWVFKQLFDKKMVYRAFKVMPFSTACGTPLSNFEANQNYKDVSDPSVVVAFKCADTTAFPERFEFVAWTTTPWTLPANLALCVHPTMTYLRIHLKSNKRILVLAKDRLEWVCKQMKLDPVADIEVLAEFPGETLRGLRYVPLFDCYASTSPFALSAFRVCVDNFVTADSGAFFSKVGSLDAVRAPPGSSLSLSGAGCLHDIAFLNLAVVRHVLWCRKGPPDISVRRILWGYRRAVGDIDMPPSAICGSSSVIQVGGPLACPIDDNGIVTSDVPFAAGLNFKAADKEIKAVLKQNGSLLAASDLIHSYPFCWRSDTPLIYKAVPSWFIRVEDMREKLQKNNMLSRWVPAALQEKRFHNWLGEAKDWCVSRNRFWGTPLPLWASEDFSQLVCIGKADWKQRSEETNDRHNEPARLRASDSSIDVLGIAAVAMPAWLLLNATF